MPSPKSDPTKPAPARSRSAAAKPRATAARLADAASKDAAAPPAAKKAPARRAPARKPAAAVNVPPALPAAAAQVLAPVEPVIVADPAADTGEPAALKKKELLSRVADLSGAKRKDVKPILEAALRVLGEALSKGEELNLPPLGKIRVNRSKSDAGTDILTLRLRRDTEEKTSRKGGKEGLAPEGEDD